MRIDNFYDKQPDIKFVDLLSSPMHLCAPKNFGRRIAETGEISARGAYIAECYHEWRDLLLTAIDDYEKFLKAANIYGNRFPIRILFSEGYDEGSYKISVDECQCIICSSTSEGARRAIYYLEEEMVKREGAFLPLGDIVRTSHIKRRITRGYFSPTNRAPKWGDELLDDIDYYPENYLNRLAHNGTNGLWIYTSFAQLINSPYLPSCDGHCEERMKKLRTVVNNCQKHGIKVYLFAIEPIGLLDKEQSGHEDMLGAHSGGDRRPLCPRIEKVREHVIYCLENIFKPINTVSVILELLKKFDSPHLGVCFDSGHANIMEKGMAFSDSRPWGQWEGRGEIEWEHDVLNKLLPHIVTCHLHDNNGSQDQHKLPGQGTVNWQEIMKVLPTVPNLKCMQSEVSLLRNPMPVATLIDTWKEYLAGTEACIC